MRRARGSNFWTKKSAENLSGNAKENETRSLQTSLSRFRGMMTIAILNISTQATELIKRITTVTRMTVPDLRRRETQIQGKRSTRVMAVNSTVAHTTTVTSTTCQTIVIVRTESITATSLLNLVHLTRRTKVTRCRRPIIILRGFKTSKAIVKDIFRTLQDRSTSATR